VPLSDCPQRVLPDGRWLCVWEATFGKGRLCVSPYQDAAFCDQSY
jgi:hypothetical protein